MRYNTPRTRNEKRAKGFTLVEILIALALVALITPIIFTFYKQFSSSEKHNIKTISVLNKVQVFEQMITIDIYNAEKITVTKQMIEPDKINTDLKIEYGNFKIVYSVTGNTVTKSIYIEDELKSKIPTLRNVESMDINAHGYLVTFHAYFIIDMEKEVEMKNIFEYAFFVYGRNLYEDI